jgi:protein-tyrosine phosphatase
MKRAGVTHVTTVLSRSEGAEAVGAAAKRAGIEWLWIDLGSTKTLPDSRRPDVLEALAAMTATLGAGGRIYLHCSAGIHRTGMIAAALLFHLDRDDDEVRAMLQALRPLTATDVGEARLAWARTFARQP